ncbi:MFS transporter [Priestia megaterium]|nr:MFS transporter [Priestia megaterium]
MKEKLMIVSLGLLPFIMVLGNSMLIPLLPDIQSSFQLNDVQTGLVLSAFSIPAAILIPVVGILSDRHGRKILILYSLLFMMLGSLIAISSAAFTTASFSIFLIGRMIQGIGAAGTTTLAIALTGDVFHREKRAKVLGILEVYNGIGKVVAPIIGATAALITWHAAFFVYPFVAVIAFIGIFLYVQNAQSGKDVISIRAYLQKSLMIVYQNKRILFPLFFIGGLGLFLVFGILYYLSFLIEETYHIDGFFKGTAFLFPLGAMTITSYWSGKRIKTDEKVMKKLLLLGLSFLLTMFAVLIIIHSLPILMFCLTIAFAGLGFVLPCINMMITSATSDEERGFVISIYGTVRFLGVAIGPIVYGVWMVNERTMFVYSFFILLFGASWVMYQMNMISIPFTKKHISHK